MHGGGCTSPSPTRGPQPGPVHLAAAPDAAQSSDLPGGGPSRPAGGERSPRSRGQVSLPAAVRQDHQGPVRILEWWAPCYWPRHRGLIKDYSGWGRLTTPQHDSTAMASSTLCSSAGAASGDTVLLFTFRPPGPWTNLPPLLNPATRRISVPTGGRDFPFSYRVASMHHAGVTS